MQNDEKRSEDFSILTPFEFFSVIGGTLAFFRLDNPATLSHVEQTLEFLGRQLPQSFGLAFEFVHLSNPLKISRMLSTS